MQCSCVPPPPQSLPASFGSTLDDSTKPLRPAGALRKSKVCSLTCVRFRVLTDQVACGGSVSLPTTWTACVPPCASQVCAFYVPADHITFVWACVPAGHTTAVAMMSPVAWGEGACLKAPCPQNTTLSHCIQTRERGGSDVVERPYTAGGGGGYPPPGPPSLPFQCLRLTAKILLRRLRWQEDLRFKMFGPPSAGTTRGPSEEGGSQPNPPPSPPSNTSLGKGEWNVPSFSLRWPCYLCC